MHLRVGLVIHGLGMCLFLLFGENLETRVHQFEYASPDLVEKQLRAIIPERPRVSMNPRTNQVIVIADAETHSRVSSMLRELGRPRGLLVFSVRHNRDLLEFSIGDGIPFSLPVSQTPPDQLVEIARGRLSPELRKLPVVGSALQAHALLLRTDPVITRLRITPAVLFGIATPYEVVDFPDLTMDIMLNTQEFIELQETLSSNGFYRQFLSTQPHANAATRPVSLLLSLRDVDFGESADGEQNEPTSP